MSNFKNPKSMGLNKQGLGLNFGVKSFCYIGPNIHTE